MYIGTRKWCTCSVCTYEYVHRPGLCSRYEFARTWPPRAFRLCGIACGLDEPPSPAPPPSRFIPLGKFRGWPLYNSAAAAAVDLYTRSHTCGACTCVHPHQGACRSQRRWYKHRYYLLHRSQKLGVTRDSADLPRRLLPRSRSLHSSFSEILIGKFDLIFFVVPVESRGIKVHV